MLLTLLLLFNGSLPAGLEDAIDTLFLSAAEDRGGDDVFDSLGSCRL